MALPGGQEQNMGPNIASVQSLLDSTRDRTAGEHQDDDKSALAIMNAIMATPSEALKNDIASSLAGGIEKAVVTVGANIPLQFSIFGPSKGTLFGFPALIESMQGGGELGDGGGDIAGPIGEEHDGMPDHMEGGHDMHDPWDFNQYPHADESIEHAARGMEGMSHPEEGEERMYQHHYSPSPSPSHEHVEHDEGMQR